MADAIPVHSKKVNVQAAPTDKNGVPVSPDYVTQVRENLGNPSDFVSQRQGVEMTSMLDLPNGKQHVHTYTRQDH